jgi:hypothetical protein
MKSGSREEMLSHQVAILPYGAAPGDRIVMGRLREALQLLSTYDGRSATAVSKRLRWILIAPRDGAQVIPGESVALLSRSEVEHLPAVELAGHLVFLATYARVLRVASEDAASRERIKSACRRAELAFLQRVPGTIDVRLRLSSEASGSDRDAG